MTILHYDFMAQLAKVFIFLGSLFIIFGVLILLAPKNLLPGKLPGDLFIKKDGFQFYLPITTSILLSLILSFMLKAWDYFRD